MKRAERGAPRPKCRHCGKRLARVYAERIAPRAALLGHGYAATGFFCTAQCGHFWAVLEIRRQEARQNELAAVFDPLVASHAEAAGERCTDDGTGCCSACGVALVQCPACLCHGYHKMDCSQEVTTT